MYQTPFEKAIAVGRRCCWCCEKLGNLSGDIKLSGSHGKLYAWSPPQVGVDMNVLKDLEDALWDELNAATCLWDIEDHPLVLSRPKIRQLQHG